ncbi:MAG: hypothetical protein R3281_10110 [Balneolaceae bacterium]|nr:hypothetical protein [Balneolaceae bacterium]
MKPYNCLQAAAFLLLFAGCAATHEDTLPQEPFVHAQNPVEAGRYLITVAGCNDCHTDGYMMNGGTNPESEWLTGSAMGWQGPWGTTYASNLRLRVQDLTEDQWVEMLKTRKTMPPMAWPSVNHMSETDLKAIYAYITYLGPKGERAPLAVAPGASPATPYLSLFPQNMPQTVPAASE